ncbi:MAG: hypothetical protein PQJ58_10360 [Spirochaetales bacterium]|nr:hypothetical protein [Spirochaetales bacterium]
MPVETESASPRPQEPHRSQGGEGSFDNSSDAQPPESSGPPRFTERETASTGSVKEEKSESFRSEPAPSGDLTVFPPMPEFREKVLKALRQERHSLSAAMDKSPHWNLEGTVLTLPFNSTFESTLIEKESREIETIIKKDLGWSLQIKTIVKHKKEEAQSQEIEEQVKLVLNIFRGTLINRSK